MEADAEVAKKEAAVEKATEENEKAVLESQAAMARLERSELRQKYCRLSPGTQEVRQDS